MDGNSITLGANTLHQYIHNWYLQTFSQDYELLCHTAYISDETYSLKSNQIFWETFPGNFILLLWCFLFCKEDVTRLQGALKKLLTNPVKM